MRSDLLRRTRPWPAGAALAVCERAEKQCGRTLCIERRVGKSECFVVLSGLPRVHPAYRLSLDLFALTGTLTGSSDIPRELLKAVERARGCHVGEDIGHDG